MENNVNGGMNGMDNSAAMPNNPMASKMNAGNNLPPMEPVVPNTPVMTTKKKSPIATICLAILAVLGIGFGVYMYMFGCKCPECKECAKCECEECEECEKCEEGIENWNIAKLPEGKTGFEPSELPGGVVESLKKYYISLDEDMIAYGAPLDVNNNLQSFSKEFTEEFFFRFMLYNAATDKFVEDAANMAQDAVLSYDEVNEIYHSLFQNGDLSKKDINIKQCPFTDVMYNSEKDEFSISRHFGCGGTGPFKVHYKIKSYSTKDDLLKIDLLSVIYNADANWKDDVVNQLYESLNHYVLILKKQGGEYILLSVE